MNKTAFRVLALAVALAALAAPTTIAYHLARKQAIGLEKEQGLFLANEIMRRADTIGERSDSARKRMLRSNEPDPCSDANIAAMQGVDVGSSYIQMMGHVSNGKLDCSSLGRHVPGLPLGPVDYVSSRGVAIRVSVELPFAPGSKFLVAEQDGFAYILHRGIVTDIYVDVPEVSLGLFGQSSGKLLTSRGVFDPRWARDLDTGKSMAFFDGRHTVVLVRSSKYDYTTYAALPVAHLDERTHKFALVLMPIGLLVGLLLLAALALLNRQQRSLPAIMRGALKRNEFFMEYQPVVDLQTGRCVGAEALLRWRRPDGSLIRPDVFIPVAEDSQLIEYITCKMMEMVAHDVTDLLRRHPDFKIAFNLSSADLQSEGMVAQLRDFIRTTRAMPENIIVEATERGFLVPNVAKHILHDIRALGIRVAIDDFGTGYSSLSYLNTLKVDYLKIDKSFVETIDTDAATNHVAQHIIEMAKSLELAITAEGVETESQATFLRQRGVHFAQGWLYGHSMSIPELTARLDRERFHAEPAPGSIQLPDA